MILITSPSNDKPIFREESIQVQNDNVKTDIINKNQIETRKKSPQAAINNNYEKCNIYNEEKQYTAKINDVIYPRFLLRSQNYTYNFDCLNKSSSTKVILGWNKFYGTDYLGYGAGKVEPFLKHNCPVTNCEITDDKSRLNEADYVVVHFSDRYDTIPKKRNENTRWVWMLIEAPAYTGSFDKVNGLFNYTSDYLHESDFGSNYISQMRMIWKPNTTFNENHDYSATKSGFATALISNCAASNRRMQYVKKLKEFVSFDVYGRCGRPCPKDVDCRIYAAVKYKFYFSFENCICKDYITEKFFIILKYDTIPVVFGGGEYSRFIPKSGYIDAQDYNSPKELADYLNYIDKNATAYNEYFQWKKHVNFIDKMVDWGMICDMCIELHLEKFIGIKQQVITDFNSYWNKSKQCKVPNDVPALRNL